MYRNFTNKRKFQDANSIGAEGTVQNIPIADVNFDDNYIEQLESTLPQDNIDLKFEDLSFSAQQDPYMRQYYGITEGTTYNPPSGMQPAGPPQASTPDMKPVTLGQKVRNNTINRLQKRLSNIEEGRENKIAKAVDLLGLGNIGTAGGYMQAFTDLPERAFARAGYNMEQGPRGKARALGNIIEASTGLGGAFLQGLGSFKKTKPMTEEEYIAAKKAEQAKKNNTVMIGDTRYTLVEDSEGRMTIGPEYQETETMKMGGRMGPKVIKNQDFYTRLDEATKGVNQSGTRNTATRSGVGEQYSLDLSTVFQSPQDLVDYYGMSSLTSDPKSTYYVNPERAKRMYELVTGSGKINPAELHMIMQARGLDSEGYENLTNAQVMNAINKVNEHMPGTYQAGPQGGFSGEQNLAAVQTALDHYGGVRRAYGVPFTPGQTAEERFSELYYEDYMASNPNTPEGNIVKLDGGMGGVMRLQNASPTMFNPFAIQTPSIQPFTMEQVDADFANVPEPSPFMTDFDMDGISDYIDIDAGEGTNQALPGVLGGPSIATPTPTDFSYSDASSPVDMTTDSDGDGIPDYQDDFDNSIVSEEERQKDIAKKQNSLFGMAASLGSAVGSDDLTSRAARAGLMAGRLLQGESPLASTIGLGAGLGSVGFGAARTMKGARAEAIATADARKRAAERLRQGIMTGGTKGRDVASLESYLQSSTYDPMATEFGQDGMMMGGNKGGMAQGGNQGTPPPKGVVIGRNTAKYFQKPQLPVSPNGLVEYPNQMVNVPTTGTITMNEEKAGGPLPEYVLAVPNGDTPVIMQNGYDYDFPNSDMVTEIPLNQALYV